MGFCLIKSYLLWYPSGHFDGILFNRNLFNMGALRVTLTRNRLMGNRLMGNSLKHISYRVLFVRKDCAIIVWKIIFLSLPHAPKSQNLQDSQTLTVPYMSDFVANISFSYTKNLFYSHFTNVIKCTPVFKCDTTERARLHFATNVASLPRPDLARRYVKNINNQHQLNC